MIIDAENVYSQEQAITATAVSENVIDLGVEDRDIGKGTPVPLHVQVMEDFDNLTSLEVQVVTSNSEDLSGSEVLSTTGKVPVANLSKGYQFNTQFMPRGTKRYVALNYVVEGTSPSMGKVFGAMTASSQTNGV